MKERGQLSTVHSNLHSSFSVLYLSGFVFVFHLRFMLHTVQSKDELLCQHQRVDLDLDLQLKLPVPLLQFRQGVLIPSTPKIVLGHDDKMKAPT